MHSDSSGAIAFVRPAILMALIAIARPVAAQEAVGFVYQARGEWVAASTGEPLVVGQGVSAAERIAMPAEASARLILWFPGGRVECQGGSDECTGPDGALDCISDPPAATVAVASCIAGLRESRSPVFAAVARWFQQQPRRYVPLMSRDFGFLSEAVVPVSGGRVDLTRALEASPANRYRLCLTRVTLASEPGAQRCDHRIVVEWTPGQRVQMGEAIAPGLYALTPLPHDGREAWVLAVDGGDAQSVRRALEEAHAATEELGIADRTERTTFERAYLMHLAMQQGLL